MIEDGNSEYEVGYGKPPRHTQFKRGNSGHPAGRPRKTESTFTEVIRKEGKKKIRITENGKSRQISKLEAIVMQQMNKAIKGDTKATDLIRKVLEANVSGQTGKLSPILSALRNLHAKHERTPGHFDPASDSMPPTGDTDGDSTDD